MRRLVLLILLATGISPRTVLAGAFAAPTLECDTLSTNPLRIVQRFHIFPEYHGCTIRAVSGSFQGSPIVPILGCVGSPNVSCSFDSLSGVATFSMAPLCGSCCAPGNTPDTPGLIVGGEGGCFFLDGEVTTQYLCPFACSSATPSLPESWGRVRSIYR